MTHTTSTNIDTPASATYQPILALALAEAEALRHPAINATHLLLALLHDERIVARVGTTLADARQALQTLAASDPDIVPAGLMMHPDAQQAVKLALAQPHPPQLPVATLPLLWALLVDHTSSAARVLILAGVSSHQVTLDLEQVLARSTSPPTMETPS